MGPWQDFLASGGGGGSSSSSTGAYRLPTVVEALKARPLRTLVLCTAALAGGFFFFALLGGPGNDHLRSAYASIGSGGRGSAVNWMPSWTRISHSVSDSKRFGGVSLRESELVDPTYTLDRSTGLYYPQDVTPAGMNKVKRASATFVALVRSGELHGMRQSMREVEAAFNRKFGYPWLFLSEEPFTDEFKAGVRAMTRSEINFGLIPAEHWSYPDWVDQTKAADERAKMEADNVIYGGSESYRHMCRFNSGFFFKHPMLQQYDYYWRVEPGVEFYCDVDYDVFHFMQQNNKTYSFTVAIYEYERTIESLWPTVREFAKQHPEHIAPDNSLNFLVDDASEGMNARYNLCHFWSNFEIADLRFWRSQAYQDFFSYLDGTGNFFYERWGDAPVHSIAAALFLPKDRLHQFDDIGYRHNPYIHCPQNQAKYHDTGKCSCDPKSSFDMDGYSCMKQWWRVGAKPQQRLG